MSDDPHSGDEQMIVEPARAQHGPAGDAGHSPGPGQSDHSPGQADHSPGQADHSPGRADHDDVFGEADELARFGRRLPLAIALGTVLGLAMTIIWAPLSTHSYWPRWVWLGSVAAISPFAMASYAATRPPGKHRRLATDTAFCACVVLILLLVWAFAGGGVFWPAWPILALGIILVAHALVVHQDRLSPGRRRLAARVETLARTRRGALDVQTVQLQRIERDLHDGAQARLVALSMQLGRAEARLEDDPEAAALVRAAREEAGAAIAELRDLARGIAPPVLADRGLEAAVVSLAERAPIMVTVAADRLGDRLPAVVETAAYFVVAEALTNVVKHAPGAAARVTLARRGDRLLVDVADGGPGGANPAGSGLDGLRARVEALDGTLIVASPAGGPTIIHAELPCE